MTVWGDLTNSYEKKRSKRQKRKGKTLNIIIIREMQIKTTMIIHCTSMRAAKSEKWVTSSVTRAWRDQNTPMLLWEIA